MAMKLAHKIAIAVTMLVIVLAVSYLTFHGPGGSEPDKPVNESRIEPATPPSLQTEPRTQPILTSPSAVETQGTQPATVTAQREQPETTAEPSSAAPASQAPTSAAPQTDRTAGAEEPSKQTLAELIDKSVSSSASTAPTTGEPASSPAEPSPAPKSQPDSMSALSAPSELELEAWNRFRASYNRTYLSREEGEHRQRVFLANHRFIKAFNERAEDALFKLGVNHFADMTRDEINAHYMSPLMGWHKTISEMHAPPPRQIPMLPDEEDSGAPQSIDWRNVTTEVVDQGTCKDSSVFAAVAAMEAAFNAQLMAEQPNATPVKLSEQQLLDCLVVASPPGAPPVCLGFQSMERVFELLQSQPEGLAGAQNYLEFLRQRPPPTAGEPQPICRMPPGDLRRAKLESFSMVNAKDIAEALLTKGPVVVALDGSQPTFHFYKSGLYHDLNCSPDVFNQHVLLVGYSAGQDAASRDRPFYLARNSFGPDWGEAGHLRMLRDEQRNKCLPQNFAISPTLASQ